MTADQPRRVRHVTLRSDEFIAGVSGEMSPAELGVYWMVCLLCYSHDGRIPADPKTLRAKFKAGPANSAIASILDSLIERGKVYREGQMLGVRRVDEELALSRRRIAASKEHGRRGADARQMRRRRDGSVSKETNGLDHSDPLHDEKLTLGVRSTPRKERIINNSELGCCAREARSAPLETGPPSEHDIAEIEQLVATATAKLNGHHPKSRQDAIEQSKRDHWLNNLAAFVGEQFDGDTRMAAWQTIEDARAAGCRSGTPPPILAALDDIDRLYRQATA